MGNDNMTKANLKNILTAVRDIINRSSEIGIRKAQAAEKRADNAQTAANNAQTAADNAQITANAAQTAADNAQTAADSAQTAADNAQTAADNAQTIANSNKEVLAGAFSSVTTYTFDKQTSGRDTFLFNAFNYYKIGNFNPAPEDVVSFKGTRESGGEASGIVIGNNCVEYGLFIVVASAGVCSIPVTDTVTKSFTAPSAGLYARYEENNAFVTAGTGEFTLMLYGLTIKSSTVGSSKKFRIIVGDSGTLSATEVT